MDQDVGELLVTGSPPGATFRVGAFVPLLRRRRIGGGGWLTVRPGAAVFEPGRVLTVLAGVPRVVHTERSVVAVTPRLVPPWAGSAFVLTDGTSRVAVVVPRWMRGRVRAAFVATGFVLVDRRTWFDYLPLPARRDRNDGDVP